MPAWWIWWWDYVQTADFCAASAHFFSGIAVVLTASFWMAPWLAGTLFLVCWAMPKECFVDRLPWGEGHGSCDWWDLLGYAVGDGVAMLILWIHGLSRL
jgi:hypothetical protein